MRSVVIAFAKRWEHAGARLAWAEEAPAFLGWGARRCAPGIARARTCLWPLGWLGSARACAKVARARPCLWPLDWQGSGRARAEVARARACLWLDWSA
ncbi:hypothetical protein TIFTF001_035600 [Ficus carica]|uniref:Uncharacterized protein n=1 Tax=Ficus carica TaxID=3494 RepID=A0AA88E2K9_FICCA|nr:hypothetical protein TIFTF001_035600 [Ficus carica]